MSEEMLKLLMAIERELGEIKATGLSTLAQATKTNGRVTCLEKTNEELSKLVSRHNGVLIKWEQNKEKTRDLINKKWEMFYTTMPKVIYLCVGLVLAFILKDYPVIIDLMKSIL